MEEFINVTKSFEIFYKTNKKPNYYFLNAYYLIPTDCYNEFIYLYRNCQKDKNKIKKLKKLLLNKTLIKWDFELEKYICFTIKDIIKHDIFNLAYIFENNTIEFIRPLFTAPMDLRYINNPSNIKVKKKYRHVYSQPYIPNILNH